MISFFTDLPGLPEQYCRLSKDTAAADSALIVSPSEVIDESKGGGRGERWAVLRRMC
jgi:hypothetical protein